MKFPKIFISYFPGVLIDVGLFSVDHDLFWCDSVSTGRPFLYFHPARFGCCMHLKIFQHKTIIFCDV